MLRRILIIISDLFENFTIFISSSELLARKSQFLLRLPDLPKLGRWPIANCLTPLLKINFCISLNWGIWEKCIYIKVVSDLFSDLEIECVHIDKTRHILHTEMTMLGCWFFTKWQLLSMGLWLPGIGNRFRFYYMCSTLHKADTLQT